MHCEIVDRGSMEKSRRLEELSSVGIVLWRARTGEFGLAKGFYRVDNGRGEMLRASPKIIGSMVR